MKFRGSLLLIATAGFLLVGCPREYGLRLDSAGESQDDVIDKALLEAGTLPAAPVAYRYDFEDLNHNGVDELVVQLRDQADSCKANCRLVILSRDNGRWRTILDTDAAPETFPVFVDCDGLTDWCRVTTRVVGLPNDDRLFWRFDPLANQYSPSAF